MTKQSAWQLAALAAGIGALLWWKRDAVVPALSRLAAELPNFGLSELAKPGAPPAPGEYVPGQYVGDATGGSLPGCNGCGPSYATQFYGTAMLQAAALASRS